MDPLVAEKLQEMSINLNNLNTMVAALNDTVGAMVRHWERGGSLQTTPVGQVAALVDVMSALVRHWERAQRAQQQAAGLGPQGGGMPDPNMGGGVPGGGL